MSPNPNLAPSSWTRDRAGSTSSRSGRRVSGTVSRASSKPRPRSTLGTSSVVPSSSGADTSTIPSETSHSQNHSLATTPIPEHSPSLSPYPPELIIRDYAYLPTDARHRTLPIPHPSPQPSSSCFGFPDLGSSSSGKKGWGGFNLLSWRGFMGNSSKRESADSSISSQPPNPDDDHEYPLTTDTDNDDDDFAFSSTSSDDVEGEGDEPYGLYRAAYAFDAMGEHEIGLEEGDYVEVRGRGGGEGWVVAIRRKVVDGVVVGREEGGLEREGLVPESYLERANNLGGEGETAGEAEDEGGVED